MSRRMMNGAILEDEFMLDLSFFGRLLWIGLILTADDQGRMQDSAALIRAKVFPIDDIDINQIESSLCSFDEDGKIVRYVANGKHILQIVSWWKHQTPAWASPSKYPPPPNWTDRTKYHTVGNKIDGDNWDKPGGFPPTAPLHSILPSELPSGLNDGDVNGDGDIKGEVEGDGDLLPPPPSSNIFQLYEQNIGIITPKLSDILKDAEAAYPAAWIPEAFAEAVKNNVRKWSYIKAILENWKNNGRGNHKNDKKPKRYDEGEYASYIDN